MRLEVKLLRRQFASILQPTASNKDYNEDWRSFRYAFE
jgi:hypothetical protein